MPDRIDRSQPSGFRTHRTLEWYAEDPLVGRNVFLTKPADDTKIPYFEDAKELLPSPHWPNNPSAMEGYWMAWELAWKNLACPAPGSPFPAAYIDTAFNDCLFMWDSAFIVHFGRYGSRAFPFQRTLDNLYSRQHPDGFICREIRVADGSDQWERSGPFSTGPNVLAWAEWNYFQNFGDLDRLRAVYAPLAAYHRWTRKNRTWPDGSYWTTGLGSGMDNMTRVPVGVDPEKEHGWMTWADATFQAVLSARILAKMAASLQVPDEIDAQAEAHELAEWANANLWDEALGFYCDRHRDGTLSRVKSVACFWALLAEVVPPQRVSKLLAHLSDADSFDRPHRVPSLSADADGYDGQTGQYWRGAVWPPSNYMVLRGLTAVGADDLAHEIGMNHHRSIISVYEDTGTFWENYAPDALIPGVPAKAAFVGWSGLGPIAVLFEYVFGLRPIDALGGKLLWDLRLTDEIAVERYPLGPDLVLNLRVAARSGEFEEPTVRIDSNLPAEIEVRWKGGRKVVRTG